MKFYHLDRSGQLREKQTLTLKPFNIDTNLKGAIEHATFLFEEGVSMHGVQYLNQTGTTDSHSEWFFEYVRRSHYHDKPSRFQSMFACSSIDDIERFKEKTKTKNGNIFLVESENFFKADMNLLGYQNSPLMLSWLANIYWSGESCNELNEKFGLLPLWEYLLTGPINILEKVN